MEFRAASGVRQGRAACSRLPVGAMLLCACTGDRFGADSADRTDSATVIDTEVESDDPSEGDASTQASRLDSLDAAAGSEAVKPMGDASTSNLDAGEPATSEDGSAPITLEAGNEDAGTSQPPVETCEPIVSSLDWIRKPVDLVVLVDNTPGNVEEIAAAERELNATLWPALLEAGVDPRLVLVSGYRAPDWSNTVSARICLGPPLGPKACDDPNNEESPHRPPQFVHFDQPTYSGNAPEVLLQTIDAPPLSDNGEVLPWNQPTRPDDPLLEEGWAALLRADSEIAFLSIDDRALSWDDENDFAEEFDEQLQGARPDLFGTGDADRSYVWHTLSGMERSSDASLGHGPSHPVVAAECPDAGRPGFYWQELSRLTGGWRYPSCNHDDYDVIFRHLSQRLVAAASKPCTWVLPTSSDAVPEAELALVFNSRGAELPAVSRVNTAADCAEAGGWYLDDSSGSRAAVACESSCTFLLQEPDVQVELQAGCAAP